MVDTKEHGGRNPLVDLAASLSILPTAEDIELAKMRGEKVADRLEDDPRFGKVAADPASGVEAANGQGSFEAFMGMFGAPPPQTGLEAQN